VKDENGDLLADSDIFFNRQKNCYSQLLSVCIRQIELHTAEPSEVEIAIVNLKKCKLPGSDQIPAELIQAGGETILRFTNPLILYGLRKNCLISGRSLLFYQSTKWMIKLTAQLSSSYRIVSSIILSRLNPYVCEVTGDHQGGY
jgi:hypothetical protein